MRSVEARNIINLFSLRLKVQICRINLFLQYFGVYIVGSAPEVQEDTKMGGTGRIVFLNLFSGTESYFRNASVQSIDHVYRKWTIHCCR